VFLLVEILLGAALVLFGWVEDDASWGRVIADVLHVVNTFVLVGTTIFVAWFAAGGQTFRIDRSRRTDRLLLGAGLAVVLIAITGTVNSLADTLALSDAVEIDKTPIAAILVSVRGIHPALAVLGGGAIFFVMIQLSDVASGTALKMLIAVQLVIAAQFIVGVLNIALLTPLETQIIHLVLADTLWILLLLLTARLLTSRVPEPAVP
jgi:heme A synthase